MRLQRDSQAVSSTLGSPERKHSSQARGPAAELKPLWDWCCDVTEGMNVTCVSWNQARAADLQPCCSKPISAVHTADGNPSSLPDKLLPAKNEAMSAQANNDMLAVGYGPHAFAPQLPGRVALWSLEDPDYPSWTFTTSAGLD